MAITNNAWRKVATTGEWIGRHIGHGIKAACLPVDSLSQYLARDRSNRNPVARKAAALRIVLSSLEK